MEGRVGVLWCVKGRLGGRLIGAVVSVGLVGAFVALVGEGYTVSSNTGVIMRLRDQKFRSHRGRNHLDVSLFWLRISISTSFLYL